jgi:hypothetical protein
MRGGTTSPTTTSWRSLARSESSAPQAVGMLPPSDFTPARPGFARKLFDYTHLSGSRPICRASRPAWAPSNDSGSGFGPFEHVPRLPVHRSERRGDRGAWKHEAVLGEGGGAPEIHAPSKIDLLPQKSEGSSRRPLQRRRRPAARRPIAANIPHPVVRSVGRPGTAVQVPCVEAVEVGHA